MVKQVLRSEVPAGTKFGLSPNNICCLALNPKTGEQIGLEDALWHVYLPSLTLSWMNQECEVYVN